MITATTFSTTHSTNHTTTKNFLSLSSQSVLEESKGPTLKERLKMNLFHISINMQRYKFPAFFINFTAIFRLVQWYAVAYMPKFNAFWTEDGQSSVFVFILKIPLHLCFATNQAYHCILVLIFTIFFIVGFVYFIIKLHKDPQEYSFSNSIIGWFNIFFQVLSPIFLMFLMSAWGSILSHLIFQRQDNPLSFIAAIAGFFGVISGIIVHFLAYFLIRGTAFLRLDEFFVPWAPYTIPWAFLDLYFNICGLIEELLPIDNHFYRLGYSILLILFYNPIIGVYFLRNPVFQTTTNGAHMAALTFVSFVGILLLNASPFTDIINATSLCILSIILLVLLTILFRYIQGRVISGEIKKLYSVYKSPHSVLPHITPLVFTAPLSSQVALSQEAYQVMQNFNSLEIKNHRTFIKFLIIGAEMRMPAITNIDFIKWGMNYFTDLKTLIISAQICQFFGENNQTQSVLLQRISEEKKIGIFLLPILLSLEYEHKDEISDKPPFMQALEKKASAGLSRCKRATSLFWGCVLKHSQSTMKEAICKVRDTVDEADTHFDELLRCYPNSNSSIALYLSYLSEVKGEYLLCNEYINETSARLIEKKSDMTDYDDSQDGMSTIINDNTKSFYHQLKNLGTYMEQERYIQAQTKAPIYVLLSNVILSLVIILASLVFVIAITLVELNKYPQLLDIINTLKDVIIEVAILTFSSRRLCLFANDQIEVASFNDPLISAHPLSRPQTLLAYLVESSDLYVTKLKDFYKATNINRDMMTQLYNYTTPLDIYNKTRQGSLTYLLDMFGFWLKSISSNLPRDFNQPFYSMTGKNPLPPLETQSLLSDDTSTANQTLYKSYTDICSSQPMNELVINIIPMSFLITNFVNKFYDVTDKIIDELDLILYWSMIIFPVAFIVLFGLFLIFSSVFIKKEAAFRNTLYLSLPEQVASEFFRLGGSRKKKQVDHMNDGVCDLTNPHIREYYQNMDEVGEDAEIKEKSLQIEALQQFSSISQTGINGTGMNHFIGWMCVYLVLSAITLFAISYYSRTVNSSFHSRSKIICYASLRYISFMYLGIHVQEFYYFDPTLEHLNMTFIPLRQLASQGLSILDSVNFYETALTFGDNLIKSDFREYQEISDFYLKPIEISALNFTKETNSVSNIVHDAYQELNFNSRFKLFTSVAGAMLHIFIDSIGNLEEITEEDMPFHIDDDTWKEFNHFMIVHLNDDLQNIASIYTVVVQNVISNGFMIALIISIASLVVLVLIFSIPIVMAVHALRGYFRMTTHILCQIPPEIFDRSMYISKWLKGQINQRNYTQFETYYKRTVSSNLQAKIINESPEKLLLFNSSLQFLEGSSMPLSKELEDPTLETILSLILDINAPANKSIIDQVQRAMEKFQEAKDNIENRSYVGTSLNGNPIRLTVSGITSASLTSTSSMQRFYAFIAILVRDITAESSQETQYLSQKERTISLLSEVVPRNLAQRMLEGEKKISFSSGICSILFCELIDFENLFTALGNERALTLIVRFKRIVNDVLQNYENVSLLSFNDGILMFIAGLFNDEQNGRTEAHDIIQFVGHLCKSLQERLNQDTEEFEEDEGSIAEENATTAQQIHEESSMVLETPDTGQNIAIQSAPNTESLFNLPDQHNSITIDNTSNPHFYVPPNDQSKDNTIQNDKNNYSKEGNAAIGNNDNEGSDANDSNNNEDPNNKSSSRHHHRRRRHHRHSSRDPNSPNKEIDNNAAPAPPVVPPAAPPPPNIGAPKQTDNKSTKNIDEPKKSLNSSQRIMIKNDDVNLSEIHDDELRLRYALCTGGPIFTKLYMDSTPVSLVFGDPVSLARQILRKSSHNLLLLERTTYECIYGMNIDCQMAGEIDYAGKHTSIYSIQVNNII